MPSKLFLYSDGGARGNPGPAAIGVLVCDHTGKILREHSETIGETTNNVAEYTAVLIGLDIAKQLQADEVDYYVDSELVARQLGGQYRVKTPHIKVLFDKVQACLKDFRNVRFHHVLRTHPQLKHVDRLLNQTLNREGF